MPRNDNPFFDSMNNAIDNLVPLALKKWQIDQTRQMFEQKMGMENEKLMQGLALAQDKLAVNQAVAQMKIDAGLTAMREREEGRDRRLDERLTAMDSKAEADRELRKTLEEMRTERKKAAPGKSGGGSAKGKNVTVYGPGGKSKSVFVPQGEDFEPEEGWTLTKPSTKPGLREALGGDAPGAGMKFTEAGLRQHLKSQGADEAYIEDYIKKAKAAGKI